MNKRVYTDVSVPRGGPQESEWQSAKKFPKYVYSTSKNGCLIHKIKEVRLRWWDYTFHSMVRLQSPRMLAIANCGMFFSLSGTKSKSCDIPAPDAVLCASCHGEGRNFPRGKDHKVSKELAKIRKGCMERGE